MIFAHGFNSHQHRSSFLIIVLLRFEKFFILKQRYKILLNYVIGPLLFIVLSYTIYRRIQGQPNLQQSWQLIIQSFYNSGKWLLSCMVILMLFNWGIEARKWQLLIKPIEPVSFLRAFRAVLSGVSFSLFIPTGDYVGKILFMHEGNRLRSIPHSAAGSMSQLIITLAAGLISLVYLRTNIFEPKMQLGGLSVFWLNGLMYVITSGLIVLLVIYYKLSWITTLLEKIPFIYKYRIFIQGLENFSGSDLTRILMLSFFRFIVFIVQYLLALHIFNVQINWFDAVATTCVLFLVLALIPTVTIAELGVRGEVSIKLFGLLTVNTLGIVATAALIWVINLIIPALAGSLFILGIKLFGNNSK